MGARPVAKCREKHHPVGDENAIRTLRHTDLRKRGRLCMVDLADPQGYFGHDSRVKAQVRDVLVRRAGL